MVITYAMPTALASGSSADPVAPLRRPVVCDLRDARTGIGRVALETVRAWQRLFPDDQVTALTSGGGRYSWRAQREWPTLRRAHPNATWVWFHWDIPWFGVPRRSVVYVHDRIHRQEAGWGKRWVAGAWMAHAFRRAGSVVTVSEATARELPVPAVVIPNGVSTRWQSGWSPADYLLTVGEPRPYKNIALAEQVARTLGVPHRHAWRVDDDALRALYTGARVVLMPSRAEGFGLPLLEAFAAGAPVVASDIPALREVGGALATYVPVDDVAGWCAAVQAAWTNGGDPVPRMQWAAGFTWDRAATQLRAVVAALG